MKKAACTIISCFLAVIVLTLSFSRPVLAASSSVVFPNYTTSVSFDITVSGGRTVIGYYDTSNTYRTYTFSDSNTAFFSIPLTVRLPLFALNDGNFFPLSELCYFRTFVNYSVTKASATNSGLRTYSIRNCYCHFLDSSFPFQDASSAVRCVVDVSDFYFNHLPLDDAVYFTCDFVGTLSSQSDDTTCSFTVSISLGGSDAWATSFVFYESDILHASDIEQQTESLNNATKAQTETVTNGYDNSSMTSDNARLYDQLAKYDAAQQSATSTSVNNIDAAEFVDPSSNASIFAAMTFSSSFLQSLYNNIGSFGIVVMVSLSLCLGLMLVGWFKFRKGG